MKKILLWAAILFSAPVLRGQDAADFKASYERQVRQLGEAGVGVETILDRWAEAFPDDCDMLLARFRYYLAKSRTSKVEPRKEARYLGLKPLLSLKDSSGTAVNYYEVPVYDEPLFARSQQAVDRAVRLRPEELSYRFQKITALLAYEKDSPDMAATAVLDLVDLDAKQHPAWTLNGEKAGEDVLPQAVQEYCKAFFETGSPQAYESFRILSERMSRLYPREAAFQDNLGTWWLVAGKNPGAALKCYKKALKLKKDDYTAARNIVLLARSEKNVKLERQYLPLLISTTPSEPERASAKARLDYLSGRR